jgi:hypothetical protein
MCVSPPYDKVLVIGPEGEDQGVHQALQAQHAP